MKASSNFALTASTPSIVSSSRRIKLATFALGSFLFSTSLIAQTPTPPPAATDGPSKDPEVFDIGKLDRLPQLKFRTAAQYPYEMRRAGVTGEVIVEFIVDTDGNVINAFAVRSSQREFVANAIAAVGKWKFKPGMKDGRTVNTRMQVPVIFTLNDE